MLSTRTASTSGPEQWSQKKKWGKTGWEGRKHACGVCNTPLGGGKVLFSVARDPSAVCGVHNSSAWEGTQRKEDVPVCKCKKAWVQKWLE